MPNIRRISSEYVQDFLALLYPNFCAACDEVMAKGEEKICVFCRYDLPQTDLHLKKENLLEKLFWGRTQIERAAACFYFHEKSKVQKLLHKLKYHGRSDIGILIGKMYGEVLKHSEFISETDMIIPVPLHKKRKQQRGYNQSDFFAKGLSEATGIPSSPNLLERTIYSNTQTTRSKYDRWNNVGHIFRLKNADAIAGKNILLVDDVITTGSTIEACAQTLLQIPDVKVRIAAIAIAS